MKINFYATLRPIVGQKTVEIDLPEGSTVHQMVHTVIAAYPALRDHLLDQNGNLLGYVHVLVNGRDAQYLEDSLQSKVTPADKIDIFPAVGGGK